MRPEDSQPQKKLRELVEEFQTVLAGRTTWVDATLPLVVFLVVNTVADFRIAVGGSVTLTVVVAIMRTLRRQPLRYALGGLGGVAVAAGLVLLLGRAEVFFLPSVITGAGTALLAIGSTLAGRPMVAWTSYLTRRWPLGWYWHAQVRPAYSEVTWAWALFFTFRLLLQIRLLNKEATNALAALNLVMGWPATVLLLAFSYLYGTWRLRNLGGPSVMEYQRGDGPPWESQQRGF